MKKLNVVCDYGNRTDFEEVALKQGFLKIYSSYYCSVDWLHSQRVDGGAVDLTQDTARITIFKGDLDAYYKFGCFFIMDTNALFAASRNDLINYFVDLCEKYRINKHFKTESVRIMVKMGVDKLFTLKSLRNFNLEVS